MGIRIFKKIKRDGFIQIGAIGAIFVAALVILFLISFASTGLAMLSDVAEPVGSIDGQGTGGGCYLKDEAFTDTETVSSADYVIEKLGNDYSEVNNRKNEIQKIIDISLCTNSGDCEKSEHKINPAILIAFWGAEQSFRNPDQAFGCGNTGDGSQGATGIEAEAKCAKTLILRTISSGNNAITAYDPGGKPNTDWSTPTGTNRWTRLLYHYVMGREDQPEGNLSYTKFGYVSSENSPRIKFLKMLIPSSIECNALITPSLGNRLKIYNTEYANYCVIDPTIQQYVTRQRTCPANRVVNPKYSSGANSRPNETVKCPTEDKMVEIDNKPKIPFYTYTYEDSDRWAKEDLGLLLLNIAKKWYERYNTPLRIGEISAANCEAADGHATHTCGGNFDIDLSPPYACTQPETMTKTDCSTKNYERWYTEELLKIFFTCGALRAHYNDVEVQNNVNAWIKEKGISTDNLVTNAAGHYSHLHVYTDKRGEF